MCDMVGQYIQKKEEEKQIKEEQAAKTRYWKILICYDDDEDCTIADFSDSNDDSTSIDDDSFSINNIEYVEASPPNSELVSSVVMEIVILKVGGIDDDILLTIKDGILQISSGSTTTRSDISLPDYEAFYDDHVKEISSGSITAHSDCSLYDSFIFDLSINPFPPADRSDFYEFADELAHLISPPEYDCFCFKNEPNLGDFTMDVVEDIFQQEN
nr:hypothetical protein [Tanacetum cinerariifolium]